MEGYPKTCKLEFYKYCVLDYVHTDIWGQYRQHHREAMYILWVLLMTTRGKFGCTSCDTSKKHLTNSSCGKLKWKTKQGGRSNASGQIMVLCT